MNFLGKDIFTKRHDRIRQFLEQEGYEAFLVLTPDNFYYVSGYFLDVAPWERPVVACIPKHGAPFLVLNELSTNHVKMAKDRGSLAIEDTHLWMEHVSTVKRGYTRLQWTDLLAAQLKSHGIDRGMLACDTGFGQIKALKNTLPKIDFAVEDQFFRELRMVKSSEELEFIRQGAKLTDYGQSIFHDLIKPGRLIVEVDAETNKQVLIKGAEMFPGCKVECHMMSLSGPASASPHGTGGDSDMTIQVGHGIVDILIVRLNGYVIENERTWIVGEPTDLQAKAFNTVEQACLAATQQMVAGNPVSSIDAAAQTVIEAAGFADHINHRTGHGIGIAGHEFPEDVAFNHRPLMVGEVWSAEPGIYIYGVGGFRHDDTVIVTENGPEVVTKWSKSLKDQIVRV